MLKQAIILTEEPTLVLFAVGAALAQGPSFALDHMSEVAPRVRMDLGDFEARGQVVVTRVGTLDAHGALHALRHRLSVGHRVQDIAFVCSLVSCSACDRYSDVGGPLKAMQWMQAVKYQRQAEVGSKGWRRACLHLALVIVRPLIATSATS